MSQSSDVKNLLRKLADPEKAVFLPRFFKAGVGEYAEGDKFLGVTVPNIRLAIKPLQGLALQEVEKLLLSPWHEERLAAVLILVNQYKVADDVSKKAIYDFYLAHTKYINNWDLVDASAEYIVGPWLENRPEKMKVLQKLASSDLLWERRIAMLATFAYIKEGRAGEAIIIIEKLLGDPHDLIQKATGWMLREIGKRVNKQILVRFLDEYAATMPRTTLRYAIEHFDPATRQKYLKAKESTIKT